MIEEYLKQTNKETSSNNFTAITSSEGEKIKIIINLTDEEILIYMESGNSIILYSNGAYQILNKKLTKEKLKTYYEEAEQISSNYEKIKNLKLNKEETKEEKE